MASSRTLAAPLFIAPPVQRENRHDYVDRLERDLASLPAAAAEHADETDSGEESMPPQVGYYHIRNGVQRGPL